MEASPGNVTGVAAIVLSVLTTIIAAINHKRIRSSCCGRKLEASLDIEQTTPPKVHPTDLSIRVPDEAPAPAK
jgi:hypothetical protein